ncbi:MAG: sugar transferase [Candidatus Margulisbacteria bacterium]|nr:sugar transferase [Candidatus Margulisiibacteriota bacterium]
MIFKVLADAGLIVFSFILAYYFRFKILLFITPSSVPIFERYLSVLIFVTLLWLAVFKLVGLYENKKFTALVDEIATLFGAVTLSTFILLGMLFLYRELWFSRLVILNVWWIAFVSLSLLRFFILLAGRALHYRGLGVRRTLILGAGEIGRTLAEKMNLDQGLGYRVVGIIEPDDLSQIKDIIQKQKVDEVIIAGTDIPAERTLDIITECERFGVEFKIVPGILELIASRVDVDELAGVPLLTVSEIRLKGLNALIKRTMDIIIAGLGLLILTPFFLLIALLIKLTSPGPVFYAQTRTGLDGKPFSMFKFRSMIAGADEIFPQLEARSEVEGHLFKMKDDPRVTRLGRFMRRFSIDELPQLLNVFFGQMSLVGPRPPLPREVVKYNAWHKKRLRVRPGITGPWQVSGRSHLPFDDMVRLDIYYIENWSLWLDLKILLRTVPVVLTARGAY